MVTLAIILWAIGLLILPLGRMFARWQLQKGNTKFADAGYTKRFQWFKRIVSMVLCVVALLIIVFIQN